MKQPEAMSPLVMKLKGIMPLKHEIATTRAQAQMVDAIRVFGADSLGAWSGTFEEFVAILKARSVFERRLSSFKRTNTRLVQMFGPITWQSASAQLIYTYKYGASQARSGINFGHVLCGTLERTGEPITYTYKQYASAISGTRWFKIGAYKQAKMSELFDYYPSNLKWKKRNNYVAKPTNSAIMVP